MSLKIKLSKYGEIKYNAADKKGHERGDMGKGKPKVSRIYSVYRIEKGFALCQARDAWQQIHNERIPVDTLEPYPSK